jgi:hypothetical protein
VPLGLAALRFAQYAFIRALTARRAAALIRRLVGLGPLEAAAVARLPLSAAPPRADWIALICCSMPFRSASSCRMAVRRVAVTLGLIGTSIRQRCVEGGLGES